MANWKKVIVSGSVAELNNLSVQNNVAITGSLNALGLANANKPNIVSYDTTTGLFSYQGTGSFSATSASYVLSSGVDGPLGMNSILSASYALTSSLALKTTGSLSEGTGISDFSFDGSGNATVAVSGASSLSSDAVTKWTGTAFANSSLTDNGTTVSGATSIVLTGANSSLTGSFTGSFKGTFEGTTNLPDLTQGTGISAFTYDGGATATVAVSGASGLNTNAVTKWTGTAFANTSLTDDGTTITGNTSIALTGANSSLTGSFSGSFKGDGSQLTGLVTELDFSGSTGGGTVDLLTQVFTINGTANEIETSAAGQTLTIGLPNNVTIGNNLVVNNNLTVFGTASFQQTTNLEVADRFILLASGSNAAGDGGIVVQQGTQNVGELFAFDSSTTRWAVTSSFSADQSTYTPDAFMAAVVEGTSGNPTSAPGRYVAKGNIFIGNDETIWIYS